jgi:hypothetical protein
MAAMAAFSATFLSVPRTDATVIFVNTTAYFIGGYVHIRKTVVSFGTIIASTWQER